MVNELAIDAISFDVGLPDMDGWGLLDNLKHDPATRHIPVHIISVQEQLERGRGLGIFGFSGKPAEREELLASFERLKSFIGRDERHLLVVGSPDKTAALAGEFEKLPGTIVRAVTPEAAVEAAETSEQDCIVLDLSSSEAQGIRFLRALKKAKVPPALPVIVYRPEPLAKKNADAIQGAMPWINRRVAGDRDSLLSEVSLFLHLKVDSLAEDVAGAVARAGGADASLEGRKVAIIDDDVRNIFSLTSVLEQYKVEVVHAEDGKSGIELVRSTPDLDLLLIDIMMPEMDGYETIRRLRGLGGAVGKLPMIAVTAKAMKGDREKCLEAGASDYLAKPIDPDQLISKVRAWLHRIQAAAE
jgi:CheY-like chemotaxis protein